MHKSILTLQKAKDLLRTDFIKYWYEEDCKDYINDPDCYWIGDYSTLACGDIFLSIDTLQDIFTNGIPRDTFYDWY